METFINEDAIKIVSGITKKMIEFDNIEEALVLLEKYISPISNDLATTILMNMAAFNSLNKRIQRGLIDSSRAQVERAQIRINLLDVMDQEVPKEIEMQQMLGRFRTSIYKTTSEENLEKILGPVNHMVKINWLQRGIRASQSVCQVLRSDGEKGTGFVLKDGYLMTNFHVLPNKNRAESAKIIFDYEEDFLGNMRKTSEFILEAGDSKFSPVHEFDYAYIKIKDNPANLLSQWGYLEVDTFSDPQIDNPVTIIQHPLGKDKQIALTANKIISINGPKLLYMTDTEKGSSGSPVFNNDWKVIALHHAGKTEQDGGLVIDPKTGEKRGANEGILIKKIVQHIGKSI